MKVTGLESAEDSSSGPVIILTPVQVLLSNNERFRVIGDPVVIRPNVKKEILKGLGKTLLGTAAGAALSGISEGKKGVGRGALAGTAVGATVAIVTRGKHIEVPAGYKIKIDRVKVL